jgi:hypothetical protein
MQSDPEDIGQWRLASLTIRHQNRGNSSPKSTNDGRGACIQNLKRRQYPYLIKIECKGDGMARTLLRDFPKVKDNSVFATEIQWNLTDDVL